MAIDSELLLAEMKKYAEVDKFAVIIEQIKTASFLSKISKAISLIPLAITLAEKLYLDLSDVKSGGGKEKKKAVQSWLDDVIDLPFYLEMIDGAIIGMAIDGFVNFLNLLFLRDWLDKAKDFLGID